MDDSLFPRGKPAVHPTSSYKHTSTYKQRPREEGNSYALFSEKGKPISEEESGKPVKRKRSTEKQGPLKEHGRKDVEEIMDKREDIKVDFFHHKRVQEGTLFLGCIREIHELELVISLPHGNAGYVQANQISESYTAKIRQHLDGELEDLSPLSEMFRIGDIVICSALNRDNSTALQLGLYPSIVNKYLTMGDLFTGQMVMGAVKSEEDHGFMIDIGKSNIKAFLPSKETTGRTLPVGTVIRATVTNIRGDGSILLLSLEEKKGNKSLTKEQNLSLDALQPGMVGFFKLGQRVKAGMVGKFLEYNASICLLDCDAESNWLDNASEDKSSGKKKKLRKLQNSDENSKPKETFIDRLAANDRIKACVLYVNPLTKQISLSTSSFLLSMQSRKKILEQNSLSFPYGEKCEISLVRYIRGLGALFRLENGTMAFCPSKHLSDKKFDAVSEVFGDRKSFPARVLQSVTLDGSVVVTLKKSVVESEFYSYDKIIPGSKVNCTIKNVQENGLFVTLGEKSFSPIKGFVPKIHIADVTLQHPEKKFSKDDVIECRVLSVDKAAGRIKLTHKRTLLKSKLPVITDYSQLQPNLLVHGYIASIKSYGVFINFYNDVHGLVLNSELTGKSLEFVENPEKNYFVGQVMKCRVVNCDPTNARAKLSFILKPKVLGDADKAQLDKQTGGHKVVDVEVVEKSENGLEVIICNNEKSRGLWEKGFVPTMHLSDFPSLASFLCDNATPGVILANCLALSKRRDSQKITRKKSVFNYHLDDSDERNGIAFSDLKEGLICPGFIHHIVPYGVFVELPGGLVGLCPKSKMADRFLLNSEGYYQENQSVVAKVVEIDSEKRRFIVTLQATDCPELNQDDTMQLYISEFNDILKLLGMRWPDNLCIGKQVKVNISAEENSDSEVLCSNSDFPEEFAAVVVGSDKPVTGENLQATLLYFDLKMKKIVLSSLSNATKGPKAGKALKATIKYLNEDIFALEIHGQKGEMAALSVARIHPNQSLFPDHVPWKLNDVIDVVMATPVNRNNFVKELSKKPPVATKRKRQESECSESSLQGETDFGNLEVGQKFEGVIKSVRNNGLLIRSAELEMQSGHRGKPVTGRLHISELENEPQDGIFPMKKYQCWNKIECKVIGFRDVRTQHFLAITKRNSVRCVLDLSLRDEPVDVHFENLEIGQEVTAFSTRYDPEKEELFVEVTPSVKGYIPLLLLSDDPTESHKGVGKCKRPTVWNCVVHKLHHTTAVFAGKGAMIDRNTRTDVSELKVDCVANGKVLKIFPSNILVTLPDGGVGKVHITDSSDDYSLEKFKGAVVGDVVRCTVLSCKNKKSLVLSMRRSRISLEDCSDEIKDKEIADAKNLQAGMIIRGFVKNISKFGIFVALSRSLTGRVALTKASKYYVHDPSIVEEIFQEGRLITCKIIKVSQMEGKVDLSMLESDTGVPELIPEQLGLPLRHGKPHEEKKNEVGLLVDKIEGRKRKKRKKEMKEDARDDEKVAKKKRNKAKDIENRDSGLDEDISLSESLPGYLKIASQEIMDEKEDPGFSWDVTPAKESVSESDASDDSEGDDQEDVKGPPKQTKKENEAAKTQEETELRRKEEMLLEDNPPETALDWDKLVLASPQNSLLWVSYMAFHLRSTEVEKARAVAERAIKTIDFREEIEKWNVWAALLNLENHFGTAESLTKTIERACRQNDPLKVNVHMVSTFERAGKLKHAEELCQKMVRKFRQNKMVWMLYVTHLMQHGKKEEANEVFKRSLQSLEKKSHLEVISKFAQLEYKSGDPEHGRVLFENALSSYPKRTDIWSVYIDMLVKVRKIEEAREVFERVTTLNLSTKNMRTFFKRFIDFETKFGNDESVAEIKEKALEYIESKTNELEE